MSGDLNGAGWEWEGVGEKREEKKTCQSQTFRGINEQTTPGISKGAPDSKLFKLKFKVVTRPLEFLILITLTGLRLRHRRRMGEEESRLLYVVIWIPLLFESLRTVAFLHESYWVDAKYGTSFTHLFTSQLKSLKQNKHHTVVLVCFKCFVPLILVTTALLGFYINCHVWAAGLHVDWGVGLTDQCSNCSTDMSAMLHAEPLSKTCLYAWNNL